VITAPKGGDRLEVGKPALAKAIAASGESIQALSRAHRLNRSQLRRMAARQVARVDSARAEASRPRSARRSRRCSRGREGGQDGPRTKADPKRKTAAKAKAARARTVA
jgi:hypothetical protein